MDYGSNNGLKWRTSPEHPRIAGPNHFLSEQNRQSASSGKRHSAKPFPAGPSGQRYFSSSFQINYTRFVTVMPLNASSFSRARDSMVWPRPLNDFSPLTRLHLSALFGQRVSDSSARCVERTDSSSSVSRVFVDRSRTMLSDLSCIRL